MFDESYVCCSLGSGYGHGMMIPPSICKKQLDRTSKELFFMIHKRAENIH
jgi:hypothetical protein